MNVVSRRCVASPPAWLWRCDETQRRSRAGVGSHTCPAWLWRRHERRRRSRAGQGLSRRTCPASAVAPA